MIFGKASQRLRVGLVSYDSVLGDKHVQRPGYRRLDGQLDFESEVMKRDRFSALISFVRSVSRCSQLLRIQMGSIFVRIGSWRQVTLKEKRTRRYGK